MEEAEVPTEHLHEHINEHAEGASGKNRWNLYVAISTALMAVFAALASLQAGHHSDEALIERIKASDQWSFFQAKGMKTGNEEIMSLISPADSAKHNAKIAKYNKDKEDISKEAKEAENKSEEHIERHEVLARAVTLLQISIAVSAISIITRKRFLWYFSLAVAIIGLWQFIMGNM